MHWWQEMILLWRVAVRTLQLSTAMKAASKEAARWFLFSVPLGSHVAVDGEVIEGVGSLWSAHLEYALPPALPLRQAVSYLPPQWRASLIGALVFYIYAHCVYQ